MSNGSSGGCRQTPGRRLWFALAGGGLLAVVAGLLAWTVVATRPGPGGPPDVEPPAKETEPSGPPLFRDMTAASGVDFSYRNGAEANHYSILESLGGGVALFDYDGDGLLDLFVAGGGAFTGPDRQTIVGRPCKLYKNLGGWKFQDVTTAVGLDGIAFYSHGAAVADYDNDGWPDLLVTGYGRLALFHNEGDGHGGRRFVEVTKQAGLHDALWSTSAAWGDLTGNGFADLYVCHYLDWSFADGKNPRCRGDGGPERDLCPPVLFQAQPHTLYRNNGKGTFRDVSSVAGLRPDGKGLGVVLADLNGDGRPDLYVANDGSGNFLYLNRGQGKLEETGLVAGVALGDGGSRTGSMGVDAADYDGSGRPSLFVTNFEDQTHALYLNLGRELFRFQSLAAGIGTLGQSSLGFGTAFVDVDNDGWEDLVFVNGHVYQHPRQGTARQRPVLLHNEERQGRRFFRNVSARGGPFFQAAALGRGLAVGDLDNDGWPDLVVSNSNGGVVLLRNEAATTGGTHWLGVRLVGKGNRPVAGATLTLEVGGIKRTRFARGGGSYLSAGDARLLFGLGATRQVGTLTVRWPWGGTEEWSGLGADAYWEIREGERQPRPLPGPSRTRNPP